MSEIPKIDWSLRDFGKMAGTFANCAQQKPDKIDPAIADEIAAALEEVQASIGAGDPTKVSLTRVRDAFSALASHPDYGGRAAYLAEWADDIDSSDPAV